MLRPAEIVSISRDGIVVIKFYKPVFVPIFKDYEGESKARALT